MMMSMDHNNNHQQQNGNDNFMADGTEPAFVSKQLEELSAKVAELQAKLHSQMLRGSLPVRTPEPDHANHQINKIQQQPRRPQLENSANEPEQIHHQQKQSRERSNYQPQSKRNSQKINNNEFGDDDDEEEEDNSSEGNQNSKQRKKRSLTKRNRDDSDDSTYENDIKGRRYESRDHGDSKGQKKKTRFFWTNELHKMFIASIFDIGKLCLSSFHCDIF